MVDLEEQKKIEKKMKVNQEAITATEKQIKMNGIKSLSLEAIRNYREELQKKREYVNKSRRLNNHFAGVFGTGAVISIGGVVYSTTSYLSNNMATGDFNIMAPILLACGVTFALSAGWMLKASEEEKNNMQAIDDQVVLIDEEAQTRTL